MGDKRMNEASRELAGSPNHMAMARRIAMSCARKIPRFSEDFESEALLGLSQSAADYDSSCGVEFSTYAIPRIFGAIKDFCRKELPRGYRKTSDIIPGTCGNLRDDVAIDATPVGLRFDCRDSIVAMVGPLPEKCRQVFLELYSEEIPSGVDVAKKFGCGKSNVRNHVSRGERSLRSLYTNEDGSPMDDIEMSRARRQHVA